jgi:MFS family permease
MQDSSPLPRSGRGGPNAGPGHGVGDQSPWDGGEGEGEGIPPVPAGTTALFSAANLGVSLVFSFLNFALPQFLDSYGLRPEIIGLLANERSLAGGLIQPLVGRLSDRAYTRLGRRRPFFLAGAPLTAVSLLVLGLHPPLAVMVLAVLAVGFFLFVAYDPYLAMMADITPPAQRGRVGAALAVASMAGAILLNLAAGFLWTTHEYLVFLVTAAGLTLTFGITFAGVREPAAPDETVAVPSETDALVVPSGSAGVSPALVDAPASATPDTRAPDGRPAGRRRFHRVRVPAGSASESRRSQGVRRLQRIRGYARDLRGQPGLVGYVVALALYYLGVGGAVPFVTLFATKALGVPAGQAFFLLIALVLSSAVVAVPVGLLADRVGKRAVLAGGLAVFAAGTLAGSQVPTVGWAVAAMVLIGAGNACPLALATPLLADLSPPARMGEVIGLGQLVWSVVQPAGSFCAGLLVTGAVPATYRHTFIWAGALTAAAAVALLLARPAPSAASEHPAC